MVLVFGHVNKMAHEWLWISSFRLLTFEKIVKTSGTCPEEIVNTLNHAVIRGLISTSQMELSICDGHFPRHFDPV